MNNPYAVGIYIETQMRKHLKTISIFDITIRHLSSFYNLIFSPKVIGAGGKYLNTL
jgi:hypothetical protein